MKRLVLLALLTAPLALALAEDSPYLENTEKVELDKPLLRVTKPAKEWSFMNLQVLKKQELAKAGSAKGRVEDAFQHLKAQMQLSTANANFYVYAWSDERKDASSEKIAGEILEQTRGFFKDKGKVVANAKATLGKLEVWAWRSRASSSRPTPSRRTRRTSRSSWSTGRRTGRPSCSRSRSRRRSSSR